MAKYKIYSLKPGQYLKIKLSINLFNHTDICFLKTYRDQRLKSNDGLKLNLKRVTMFAARVLILLLE